MGEFSKKTIKAMEETQAKKGEKVIFNTNKDGSIKSITYGNKTFSQKSKPKRKDSHVKAYKKQVKKKGKK